MTPTDATRLVGLRVDALVIAFALEADPNILEYLAANAEECRERGSAVLEFRDRGLAFEVQKTQLTSRIVFSNLDVRCQWDENAAGGWNLTVTPCATYLATHSIRQTLALARRVAECIGPVTAERMRRVDLAADYQGFPLCEMGQEALQTKRSRTVSFETEAKDVHDVPDLDGYGAPVRVFRAADSTITGYVVSPGNPIMARLYDKTIELKHPGREHKAELEHTIWRGNGWDGETQVTRVEFQLRGEVLDEMKLRNPAELEEKLDQVWQYCTRWLRCIDLQSATRRKRCDILPAWVIVRETKFRHTETPITRKRVRGGATVENMFGTLISYLGRSGRLRQMFAGSVERFVDALDFEAVDVLKQVLEECFTEAAKGYVAEMLNKHGWREAALRAFGKVQATHARFFDSDKPEPYFEAPWNADDVRPGRPIVLPNGKKFWPMDGFQWDKLEGRLEPAMA